MAAETQDTPMDFAAIATKIATTERPADGSDPVIQTTQKVPVKETPRTDEKGAMKADPKRIPDELFGGKKEEAKTEPTAPKSEFDAIADPVFQDQKRKADWDGVKAKGREWEKKALENEKKATELQSKIAEFESKGKDSEALQAKLAAMEKEHGEMKALVQKVNIELDPEFRSVYVEGRNKLVKNAMALMEESSLNPKDIEVALNLQGKPRVEALKAIAEEMDGFQQGRLGRLVDQLNDLDQAAAAKRSNPEEYFATATKEREEQERRASQELVVKANVAYDTALKNSKLEVLNTVEGLDWWNTQKTEIETKAREVYLNNTDPQVAATICLQAEAMPVYRQLFVEQRDENAKLSKRNAEMEAELKKLYGNGNPKLAGSTTIVNNGNPNKDFATHASDLMAGRANP